MAKKRDLTSLSIEDINTELVELEAKQEKMGFDHAIAGLENPISLRDNRRVIARLKTELRNRQLAEMSPEELAKRSKIRHRRRRK